MNLYPDQNLNSVQVPQKGVELKQAEFQTMLTDARLNYWKA